MTEPTDSATIYKPTNPWTLLAEGVFRDELDHRLYEAGYGYSVYRDDPDDDVPF